MRAVALTQPTGPTATSAPRPDPPGFAVRQVLGRGGMGEVLLATDEKFARPVAVKRMLGAVDSVKTERFLREARIQARLEHPSIVPVHELGVDPDGRPFFTMRRLSGTTLSEILRCDEHRPQQQLLRAFVDVCRAIDLAHAQRVIHRDLKPANIMLGDYGEVYVLDWGVARTDEEPARGSSPTLGLVEPGATDPGTILGTPGYMAPEQARGELVGPAADSYSLGCILGEILSRRGDPPPELDAICKVALAEDPDRRPTARELADRVERYLDGDRDLERRRALAADHLAHARIQLAAGDRGGAVKSAGRAIALDPELAPAVDLASALILEPPDRLPSEIVSHLDSVDAAFSRRLWGQVALAFLAFFAFVPIVLWQGVREPWLIVSVFAFPASMMLYAIYFYRGGRPRDGLFLIVSSLGMMFASRMFGVLVVLPGLLGIQLVGYVAYPPFMRKPWLPITTILITFAVPLALEAAGFLSRTWEIIGDTVVVRSSALSLGGPVTVVMLIAIHVTTFLVLGLFAWSLANARREAQRAVEIQAWHLRKLLA